MFKSRRRMSYYFLSILILFALFNVLYASVQPSYQVSLYLHLHPKSRPVHFCNGVIIQSRLVLTTATCIYYRFLTDGPLTAIPSSMISIVAGSNNAISETISVRVSDIFIYELYNPLTMENDLAILRLNSSLPLGLRDDIKWIILDDDRSHSTRPCLGNFNYRNVREGKSDYTKTEEMSLFDIAECQRLFKYPNSHGNDICSIYVLPTDFECKSFAEFADFNGDRGSGLICNSRLVAVLSTILPLQDSNRVNCSEVAVRAFYTPVSFYLDWIYGVVAVEEYMDVMSENYTFSDPYHELSVPILDYTPPESETTPVTVPHNTIETTIFVESTSTTTSTTTSSTTAPTTPLVTTSGPLLSGTKGEVNPAQKNQSSKTGHESEALWSVILIAFLPNLLSEATLTEF